jgi:hypothetical protein
LKSSHKADGEAGDLRDWDKWLVSQEGRAGFCQTSDWARIHAAANGAISSVVSVNVNGARVAGALVSLRPSIRDDTGLAQRWRLRIAGKAGGTLECFEGPVLPAHNVQGCLEDILSQVTELARRLGINHVHFAGAPVLAPWAGSKGASVVFQEFGYEETIWLTSVVDLTSDEETLRRNLKQAARKGIRKSLEGGLIVKHCKTFDEFIGTFCKAYYETADAGEKHSVVSRGEALWLADEGRHYRFFVIEDSGGNIHATLGTYRYQGVVTEIMSGRTSFGRSSSLPAQDLLHWETMVRHKRGGDRYFNLAGFSPNPVNEKEAGIRRFKEKWGGREISVPSYTWSREPGYMPVVRWVRSKVTSA